jgi:hypothetical protein
VSELVAVFLERNGKDEFRFVPPCDGCGVLIHDLTQANVAVIKGSGSGKLVDSGTYGGAKVSRIDGHAAIFCWDCDSKRHGNVPWLNAALVFRDRNDPAQQKLEPGFRSVSTRRAGYAR